MKTLAHLLPLLFILPLAPACAPDVPPPPPPRPLPTVLLTDTLVWEKPALTRLRDSLTAKGNRVLVSGYPGETSRDLLARLPWLLQPGTAKIIYDPRLAGAATADSLRAALQRLDREVEVSVLPAEK